MRETTTKPRKRPQRGDGGKFALWVQCVGESCLLWHAALRPEVRVGIMLDSKHSRLLRRVLAQLEKLAKFDNV